MSLLTGSLLPWTDAEIQAYRTDVRQHENAGYDDWDSGCCHLVTEGLEVEGLGVRVGGYFLDREPQPCGRTRAIDHFWLVLPDGSILDPTADQFRLPELGGIARIPAGDERQAWYQSYAMHEPSWHKQQANVFLDCDVAERGCCDDCEPTLPH